MRSGFTSKALKPGGNKTGSGLIQIQGPLLRINPLRIPVINPVVAAIAAGVALMYSCIAPVGKTLWGKASSTEPSGSFPASLSVAGRKPVRCRPLSLHAKDILPELCNNIFPFSKHGANVILNYLVNNVNDISFYN